MARSTACTAPTVLFTLIAASCGGAVKARTDAGDDVAADEGHEIDAREDVILVEVDGEDAVVDCTSDGDCDDGNVCTDDHCTGDGTCEYEANSDPCDDGDPCTGPDACEMGRCTGGDALPSWYADGDGDGYGNPDDVQCSNSAPEGYVDNQEDCCDSELMANPDQTEFFAEEYHCIDTGEVVSSWDYDCDTMEERRWEDVGRCEIGSFGVCSGVPGWQESVPGCGSAGTWIEDCDWGSYGCVPSETTSRVQECI